MAMVTALLLLGALQSCAVPAAEVRRQSRLSYEQFDGAPGEFAWRDLNGKGCADAAVQLLSSYGAANEQALSAEQKSELAFHQGQVLAFAGRDEEALPFFRHSSGYGGTAEWTTYVAATIAFLQRDHPALQSARERYAAIAPDSIRLKIIDGFLACPGTRYMEAAHCRM